MEGLLRKIEIKVLETQGIEDRGNFYDGVGALRDIGENHMLQMLAFVTMDDPGKLNAKNVREKRYKILSKLGEVDIAKTIRAQYEQYLEVEEVSEVLQQKLTLKFKLK